MADKKIISKKISSQPAKSKAKKAAIAHASVEPVVANEAICAESCDATKRDFVTLSAYSMMGVGAACVALPFVDSLNPSADVLAVSSVEVDVSKLTDGQEMKVMWRGKPVIIKKRSQADIEVARKTELTDLKDPEQDQNRVKAGKDQYLVMIAICTHLGCVPRGNGAGDFGGWLCPCHGSHYDTSGRIRKGPAMKNLAIPEYTFINDTTIKIG